MTKNIFLFLLFSTILCYSQINNTIHIVKKKDSLLVKYLEEGNMDAYANLAYKTSILFYKKENYNKAIYFSKKEIVARKNSPNQKRYKKSLFNLGFFYYKNKQYYKSIEAYSIVIDSFAYDSKTDEAYCQLGKLYIKIGDYFQADIFYNKGLQGSLSMNKTELLKNYLNYARLSDFIETKKSLANEFLLLNKANKLSKTLNLSLAYYYRINFYFGNYYKNDLTFNYNKSLYFYKNVLRKAKFEKDTVTLKNVYNNLGILLNSVKNDSAYYYLNKGIKLSKETNPILPKLYNNLGQYHSKKEEVDLAILNADKALQLIISQRIDSTSNSQISLDKLYTKPNKGLSLIILKNKGTYLLEKYVVSKNNEDAQQSLYLFLTADKIIDLIKEQSIEKKSKLFWQKEASEIYLQGVKASHILNKPEMAFYFMEKNKALLLLENISKNQLRSQANIPTSVLEEELTLKQKIISLENTINNNYISKDSLEIEYYEAKIKLSSFILSLEKEYPIYYKYNKPIDIINLQNIQASMHKNTMVLEYILNDTDGYLLAITKNKTSLHKLDSLKNLNKKIDSYLSLISKPISTKESQERYSSIAHELYKSLLPTIDEEVYKNITNLVIIPDYNLQNIPFESLNTSSNNTNYLINKFEISYSYSLSFLEKNTTSKRASNSFIGFAPYTFNNKHLATLTNSKEEILNANKYFSGDLLIDTLATKSNFLSKIKNYEIIHLATHANGNDSITPWIAFKNDRLYLNELYTLKTDANLVVLSACKTSLGKINPGEGAFSLARGFFYAGAKSVISTLWNVNDKSSQEILNSFYSNLKKGKSKSESLRQAKLNYINSHQLSEQSPYYWSSFILIGDTNAIEINSSSDYYPYIFILFLIVLATYLLKKKKM